MEILGFGVALVLAAALGVWLYARHNRRPGQPPAAGAAAVSFACSACGKNLKARVELAGRKVKCSGCGQAVAVPMTEPAGS